jgi:cell division protein FtsB
MRGVPMPPKQKKSQTQWIYFAIFISVLAIVSPGRRGLWNQVKLRQKEYQLRQEIKELQARKAKLEEEIKKLEDPKVIEQIAREKYGMAKKDEKVYRVVPEEQK